MSYALTQREYSTLKSRLTRAVNSKNADKILAEVENAVEVFNAKGWPDDWNRWRIAADDALPLFDERRLKVHQLFF